MKANFKVILSAIGVAAFLAFPTMTKAQGTVTPLRAVPSAGDSIGIIISPGLDLEIGCHTPAVVIEFQNVGSGDATFNFFYSDGTTVNASGVVIRPEPQPGFDVLFNGKRIEGEFIFANDAGNTALILHAFDGGTFCEIQGILLFGPIGSAAAPSAVPRR